MSTHRIPVAGDGAVEVSFTERGNGLPVLLLHGFPEFWYSWRYQLPALAAAGLRVVAPDLRGYGATDKVGPYDLDTLASDVCGLIRAVGAQTAHVVGTGQSRSNADEPVHGSRRAAGFADDPA